MLGFTHGHVHPAVLGTYLCARYTATLTYLIAVLYCDYAVCPMGWSEIQNANDQKQCPTEYYLTQGEVLQKILSVEIFPPQLPVFAAEQEPSAIKSWGQEKKATASCTNYTCPTNMGYATRRNGSSILCHTSVCKVTECCYCVICT